MEHGRDHDNRTRKQEKERNNNTPPDPDEEKAAYERERRTAGFGSEHAPTRQATEKEAERHAQERQEGHFAAGTGGRLKSEDR